MKQTYFKAHWLKDKEIGHWVEPVPGTTKKAGCKICHKTFALSNMGRRACTKHAEGSTHQGLCKLPTLQLAVLKKKSIVTVTEDEEGGSEEGGSTSTEKVSSKPSLGLKLNVKNPALAAEIRWALAAVATNQSDNSQDIISDVFNVAFPDDPAGSAYSCKRTKMAYLVKYGLYPHFENKLLSSAKQSAWVVFMFDESFNRTTQTCQMDFQIRFWDSALNQVVVRYLTSEFLGHTAVADLFPKIQKVIASLGDRCILIQFGMDGPKVNHALYKRIVADRINNDLNDLIDIGTCSLHVVHGGLGHGVGKSGWPIKDTLKSANYMFRDSPARHEDYLEIAECDSLPLPFGGMRWVEDERVAAQLINLWPGYKKVIKFYQSKCKSKQPKCKSFPKAVSSIENLLTPAELKFFRYVASILSPYLTMHQTDSPMVVFMYEDLRELIFKLLKLVVKPAVLDDTFASHSHLIRFDVDKEANFLLPSQYNLGISVEKELQDLQKNDLVSKSEIRNFRVQAKELVVGIFEKIIERSPITKPLCKQLSYLAPSNLAKKKAEAIEGYINKSLLELTSKNIVTPNFADKVSSDLGEFIRTVKRNSEMKELCVKFDKTKDRVDVFYVKTLHVTKFKALFSFMQLVFCLSHGQSSVERGFSINRDTAKTNMHKDTFIRRRLIKDHLISTASTPATFHIDQDLMISCTAAKMKYDQYMADEKKRKEKNEAEVVATSVASRIAEMEAEKLVLTKCNAGLLEKFTELFEKGCSKQDMNLMLQANGLKRKREENEATVAKIDKKICELKKRKTH